MLKKEVNEKFNIGGEKVPTAITNVNKSSTPSNVLQKGKCIRSLRHLLYNEFYKLQFRSCWK